MLISAFLAACNFISQFRLLSAMDLPNFLLILDHLVRISSSKYTSLRKFHPDLKPKEWRNKSNLVNQGIAIDDLVGHFYSQNYKLQSLNLCFLLQCIETRLQARGELNTRPSDWSVWTSSLLWLVSISQVLGLLAVASVTCLVAILSADCIQTQLDTWRAARHKNVDFVWK